MEGRAGSRRGPLAGAAARGGGAAASGFAEREGVERLVVDDADAAAVSTLPYPASSIAAA